MKDEVRFPSDYRDQATRLALIRMGLRREKRSDSLPASEALVQRAGYFGLKMHLETSDQLEFLPAEAGTHLHLPEQLLLAFLRMRRPQFD